MISCLSTPAIHSQSHTWSPNGQRPQYHGRPQYNCIYIYMYIYIYILADEANSTWVVKVSGTRGVGTHLDSLGLTWTHLESLGLTCTRSPGPRMGSIPMRYGLAKGGTGPHTQIWLIILGCMGPVPQQWEGVRLIVTMFDNLPQVCVLKTCVRNWHQYRFVHEPISQSTAHH